MIEFSGKRILVTGACGTVGSKLIELLSDIKTDAPEEILGIDNSENSIFFADQHYQKDLNVNFQFLDIKNKTAVRKSMEDIDIVFHTAALKHVILSERSPSEVVDTNIIGLQNLIDCAVECGVGKFIFTSSDKAVNPTNVMGTSKLMGERLVTAANNSTRRNDTILASTRFGNVLGSNGSVFKIFQNQIRKNEQLTITDENMTRFVMSVEDSARLVLESSQLMKGGEVFITKMPVVRIIDLARAMIAGMAPERAVENIGDNISIIGPKPGEKLYEELMSDEETGRSIELAKFFVVLPAFRGIYNKVEYVYPDTESTLVSNPYNSSLEPALEVEQVLELLKQYKLLV